MKFGAHRTSHLTSISHLTTKPTHDDCSPPARCRWWEDVRALYCARKHGLVAASKRMQAKGMTVHAAASERCVTPPPAKKIFQNPLEKRSRHAIPSLFQPKPCRLTLDCHVFHDCNWADRSI